jgi:hypothetical protein
MKKALVQFMRMIADGKVEIYNEFSLQHEFGIFLRNIEKDSTIQFERNVSFFFPATGHFHKKEIDLVGFSQDRSQLHYAIEFKFPRNGQHPEQMYSFCKDIAFLEQLKLAGFEKTYFICFVDDHLFYEGPKKNGIYRFFRGGDILTGDVCKPTKPKNEKVSLAGQYQILWMPVKGSLKCVMLEA